MVQTKSGSKLDEESETNQVSHYKDQYPKFLDKKELESSINDNQIDSRQNISKYSDNILIEDEQEEDADFDTYI